MRQAANVGMLPSNTSVLDHLTIGDIDYWIMTLYPTIGQRERVRSEEGL